MVSAWLGAQITLGAVVLHFTPPPLIGGWGKPQHLLRRGSCKAPLRPRPAFGARKRLHLDARLACGFDRCHNTNARQGRIWFQFHCNLSDRKWMTQRY